MVSVGAIWRGSSGKQTLVKELHDMSDGIGGHGVVIREIEAAPSAWIDDLLCWRSNRFGEFDEFLTLCERDDTEQRLHAVRSGAAYV